MDIRDISEATAVFSDAFQFPGTALNPEAPPYIERDRVVMAARPGMLRKLLPIRQDPAGVFCGGCYLFDTVDNARAYGDWVANEFRLDGETLFLDRPEFLEPTSQLWQIVGARDFGDVTTQQTVMRFERWHVPSLPPMGELRRSWDAVEGAAGSAGATSAWLLSGCDEVHPQLGTVTAYQADPSHAGDADNATLDAIGGRPSVGAELAKSLGGTKVFDRTSWIYMIWFPIDEGDTSPDTALWPVSPPLPGLS